MHPENKLNKKKLLECIYCSSNNIQKSIMAPGRLFEALLSSTGVTKSFETAFSVNSNSDSQTENLELNCNSNSESEKKSNSNSDSPNGF